MGFVSAPDAVAAGIAPLDCDCEIAGEGTCVIWITFDARSELGIRGWTALCWCHDAEKGLDVACSPLKVRRNRDLKDRYVHVMLQLRHRRKSSALAAEFTQHRSAELLYWALPELQKS